MSEVTALAPPGVERYRAVFTAREAARREPDRISILRRGAFERFAEAGFPTVKQEAWKYTNPAAIARTTFGDAPAPAVTAAQVAPHLYEGCAALVFVNGRFSAGLSQVDGLPEGMRKRLIEQRPRFEYIQ